MVTTDPHAAYAARVAAANDKLAPVNAAIRAALGALAEHERKRRQLVRALEDAYEAAEQPNADYRAEVDAAHAELLSATADDGSGE